MCARALTASHRAARAQDYLVKTILEGIPPLGERVKQLRERELARRGAAVENDIKSQTECVQAARALERRTQRWS